eukprot:gene10009-biopygen1272
MENSGDVCGARSLRNVPHLARHGAAAGELARDSAATTLIWRCVAPYCGLPRGARGISDDAPMGWRDLALPGTGYGAHRSPRRLGVTFSSALPRRLGVRARLSSISSDDFAANAVARVEWW